MWKTIKRTSHHIISRGTFTGFFSQLEVMLDQLVVVSLRQQQRGREIEGLRLNPGPLSFASVCWLSSSKQIETNRILLYSYYLFAVIREPSRAGPGWAGLSLEDCTTVQHMSSATAKRILMYLKERLCQKHTEKNHIKHLLIRGCLPS